MKFKKSANGLLRETGKKLLPCITILACLIAYSTNSSAFNIGLGDESFLDIDTTLTYGASVRMDDAKDRLLSNVNADDGNRSFEKHDLISNMVKINSDILLEHKNVGAFTRVRAFYDSVYDQKNANDSPATQNNFIGGSISDHRKFTDDAKDLHRSSVDLLDAFVYGNFYIADRQIDVRAGKQVISWGESLFTQGGISSAQSPVDARMVNSPGVELKDVFMPVGQFYSQIDVISNLAFAGYYQWEWEKTQLNAPGTYFSTSDLLDDGGSFLLFQPAPGMLIPIPRGLDKKPGDDGQWGISLRYLAPELNETEFGLYYINYHEKTPNFNLNMAGGNYFLSYAEDVKLYGASVSSAVGSTNVSGEIAYRQDYPVQVLPAPLFMYDKLDIAQGLISVMNIFGPAWFIDNTTFIAEIGMNHVIKNNTDKIVADQDAWGYQTQIAFDFFSILHRLDLKVPITWKHNPNGVSALAGTFTEGSDSISLKFDFLYDKRISSSLGYTAFVGSPSNQDTADRDFASFNIKYTF
ncbi:MAG: DUF1302 domain-containing protein [Desulfobacteraceae bacterium]|jgi:hypothetical protein|nr:MAG: DUF1302 domain-containing protein [Desulfobacteraceae bacterium]